MRNLKVAQQFPNSLNNKITLKLSTENTENVLTLKGKAHIIKNGKSLISKFVNSNEDYNYMLNEFNNIADELCLTEIDESIQKIYKY